MRKNLLPSVATVFAFWWFVLTIAALFKGNIEWSGLFFTNIARKLTLSGFAFAWGAMVMACILIGNRIIRKAELVSDKRRGITVSLGPFPVVADNLPRLPLEKPFPKRLDLWVSTHDQKPYYPHLELIYALAETLEAHPLVPAGRIGDHGDRTLREHTYNVVEEMLKLVSNGFTYDGLKLPRGAKGNDVYVYKPADPLFQLLIHDPLIPLAALAHDIGKLEAYQLDDRGNYQLVRKDHDHRGQMILGRFPEFWRLPEDDRQPLLDIVGYYHHYTELPRNSEERSRALISALCEADDRAGRSESKNPVRLSADESRRLLKRTQDAKKKAGQVVHKIISTRDENVSPDFEKPEGQELSQFHGRLIEAFDAVIIESNRINGTSRPKRLGIKKGKYLYMFEHRVIEAVAEKIDAPHLAIPRATPSRENVISSNLLYVLHKRGVLYTEHNGYKYPPPKALFNVELTSPDGKLLAEYLRRVFVIKVETYPELRMQLDLPFKIKEMYPSYSINAALNRGNPGSPNAPGDNAANPTDSSPVAPTHPLPQGEAYLEDEDGTPDPLSMAAFGEDEGGAFVSSDAENSDDSMDASQGQMLAALPDATRSHITEDAPAQLVPEGPDGQSLPTAPRHEDEAADRAETSLAPDAPSPEFGEPDDHLLIENPDITTRFVEEAANAIPSVKKPSKAKRRQMEVARQAQQAFQEAGGSEHAPTVNLNPAEKLIVDAVRMRTVELIEKTIDGKDYYLVKIEELLAGTTTTGQDMEDLLFSLHDSQVVSLRKGASGNFYAAVPK